MAMERIETVTKMKCYTSDLSGGFPPTTYVNVEGITQDVPENTVCEVHNTGTNTVDSIFTFSGGVWCEYA